ncbi:Nestin [Dissostichus eleginoides]|uniref:Nestin n=1 Tax=Dissostichus eleginoides TaxID=100907 RepID=A0AAD9EVZ7_DISEL|nr:Nestin [Dissostichus eleginoides]
MKKMRDTLEYRQRLVHDPDRYTVLSVFPRLLDTKGLILQDFSLLFGSETPSKLLEKWPTSFKAKVIQQAEMLTSTPLLKRLLLSAKNQRGDEPSLESPGTSKEAICNFFIVFDKKLIPLHFVLGTSYDPALKSMYTFLQTTVYNIDVDTTSESPKVKELRTKFESNV